MKTTLFFSSIMVLASTIIVGCKDDKSQPTPTIPAACRIKKEFTVGAREYVAYAYEGELPKQLVSYDAIEMPDITLDVLALEVRKSFDQGGFPTVVSTHYASDYLRVSPGSASVSITYNNVTTTDTNIFLYRYDYKGRMIEVLQHTPNTTADLEYMLTISYDDNDNVTRLLYELATGPRDQIVIIDASGYDDHPTPYAGVIGWKFLMSNFTWNNADPLPVLLALSKNNPAEFHAFHTGKIQYSTTLSYQYNEKGFPTQRDRVNKNDDGEAHSTTAFEYECR
jgi:hypothetical protein